MRLERILRPKSIAAIGGLQAGRVVEQCKLMGGTFEDLPVFRLMVLIMCRNLTLRILCSKTTQADIENKLATEQLVGHSPTKD